MNPTRGILGILVADENRPQRLHLNMHNACVRINNKELIFHRLNTCKINGKLSLAYGNTRYICY